MKKLTVLLICCLTSMVMTAAPVTAEQAKQTAIKFLNHKSSNRRTAKALNLQRRVLNAVSINERPMVYAFNVGENDGFVLVSGSDLTDEVIGYSDHGTFDEEQMPDNMRSWLRSYAKAVRQLEISGKTLNKATTK
ncbi:MAG: Spi family protease inhibitor, partial [Prevotella sp.]|nr:Spi family protease inhibitor [Prevotella sp.]